LSSLQRYLEVQPEQLVKALGILKWGDRDFGSPDCFNSWRALP
jgi:hypothetical protein